MNARPPFPKARPMGARRFGQLMEGARWIATNDEPDEMDKATVASLVSVLLLADLLRVDPVTVAECVLRIRHHPNPADR